MGWLRSLRRRWRGFLRLDRSERLVFVQALQLLPLTRLGLRTKGMNTVQPWLDRKRNSRWTSVTDKTLAEAHAMARAVRLAADHGVGDSNCLPRSLVLWALLRRRGIEATLRIGVGGNGTEKLFHAWVEHGGEVVNDSPDVAQSYLPFGGAIEPRDSSF